MELNRRNNDRHLFSVTDMVVIKDIRKYTESNSSGMSRGKCGLVAAVNSIRIHLRVAESNNININPPDTSVSERHAAQSLLSALKTVVCTRSKLQHNTFVSTKYS